MKFYCKHYTFFIFLKCLLILVEIWSTFARVSHLNVTPIAYRGSKFSKKHSSYSWTIHTARIFENNFISLNGERFIKCPNFSNIQCSISLLCLKIGLRVSLLTYRNSYIIYLKNVFSMTLNFNFKVKLQFV